MLSNRLLTLAKLVDENSIVADIGSDHGLLPIYLVLERNVKKAYAIDNKSGPLKHAIENIEHYKLEDQVITSLSDGLDDLSDDVNCVVIAGMGYFSIKKIIEKSIVKAQNLDSLIIQCNNHLDQMRTFLNEKGYSILNENFLSEKNKDYNILKVKYTGLVSEINPYVSEFLIEKNDEGYFNYLTRRLNYLRDINESGANLIDEYEAIKAVLKIK